MPDAVGWFARDLRENNQPPAVRIACDKGNARQLEEF